MNDKVTPEPPTILGPKLCMKMSTPLFTGRCKDCIEKCRMMLLLMRRFPDSVPKNGVSCDHYFYDDICAFNV